MATDIFRASLPFIEQIKLAKKISLLKIPVNLLVMIGICHKKS